MTGPPRTPAAPSGAGALLRQPKAWGLFAGFFSVLAAVWVPYYAFVQREQGASAYLAEGAYLAATDAASWALACLAGFLIARAVPLRRARLAAPLALTALLCVGVVLLRLAALSELNVLVWDAPRMDVPDLALRLLPWHMLALGTFVGAGHGIRYVVREREQRLAVARLQAEVAEARVRALAAQVRPRFLFDTLAAARRQVRRDPAAAERLLALLGELLRQSLRRAGADRVELHQELGLAHIYLEVERARGAAPVRIRSTVPAGVRHALVPHLGVFPLVESALACGGGAGPGEITVTARADGAALEVEVRDDGPLRAAEREAHPGGEPVARLRARLAALGGDAFALALSDAPGGQVVARLRFPLRLDA